MTDCFALLGEARRPWVETEPLKQKFLLLCAAAHPDRLAQGSESDKKGAEDRCAELNAAYNRLRDPKERLRHLLELERGAEPCRVQSVPGELMAVALAVGKICRETDAFLVEKRTVRSPLLQVQLFQRSQHCLEQLQTLQAQLNSRWDELMRELKTIDARWQAAERHSGEADSDQSRQGPGAEPGSGQAARTATLEALEKLQRLFSFHSRWGAQIQERLVRLSL